MSRIFLGARAQSALILVKLTELSEAQDLLREKETQLEKVEQELRRLHSTAEK